MHPKENHNFISRSFLTTVKTAVQLPNKCTSSDKYMHYHNDHNPGNAHIGDDSWLNGRNQDFLGIISFLINADKHTSLRMPLVSTMMDMERTN